MSHVPRPSSGNATHIQGRFVASTAPADGQVYAWSAANQQFEPVDQSGGGSGIITDGDDSTQYRLVINSGVLGIEAV